MAVERAADQAVEQVVATSFHALGLVKSTPRRYPGEESST